MTVIVVRGIGPRFQALSAELSPSKKSKTFYFRLPDGEDALECIKLINGFKMNRRILNACIAKKDFKIRVSNKPTIVSERTCRKLKLAFNHTKEEMFTITSRALLCELYSKFPGILSLSERTKTNIVYKLFEEIQRRVQDIQDKHDKVEYSNVVSEEYRSIYPHRSDFALVKGCYHAAGGVLPLNRQDLMITNTESTVMSMTLVVCKNLVIHCLEIDTAQRLNIDVSCIRLPAGNMKIRQYIESLNTEQDGTLDKPRLIVRRELQKLSPYIHSMMQATMSALFAQDNELKLKIYGIPTLPPINVMRRFLKDFDAEKLSPFPDLHNCVDVTVPRIQRDAILAYDGSTIEGCRLKILQLERGIFRRLLTEAYAGEQAHEESDQ